MSFEVERGTSTVEYEVEFEISPGEPERPRTYDCGGTPAYPPEVESKAVFYVFQKTCPDCKGIGTVPEGATCQRCRGAKRITVRDERPELECIVDDDELLEYAGEQGDDGPDTTAEARGER